MLYSAVTPAAKRAQLRAGLSSGVLQRFPGAFTPLSTKAIERRGFEGVYVSGAVVSNELGLPDIGLTTLTELAARANQVSRATDLPTMVDADTGFGEPMNVARTVQTLEEAGASGLHIEDQVNPKRCGHLDGKDVVDETVAVNRIRAAVAARRDPDLVLMARTDARDVLGLDGAIDRMRRLEEAGADAIFPEAMRSLADFEAVRSAIGVPILANMTEFGKSDLFTTAQLRDVGVNMVIFPVSLQRIAMGAIERALEELDTEGTLAGTVPQMQTRARLYDLIDYGGYAEFDGDIFNFDLANNSPS